MSDKIREAFDQWFAESGMTKFKETAWAAWEAALAQQPAPAVPEGITLERIERHAQLAGGCPSSARVVLLSSIKRMLATPAAPVAQEPERELVGYACDRRGALIQERCGDCLCWPAYENAAPPAAEQTDTVAVPRATAIALLDDGARHETWLAQDALRAILAGGEA